MAEWPNVRLPKLVAGRPRLPACPGASPGDRALCLIYHMAIHQAGRNASGLAPPYPVKNKAIGITLASANVCRMQPVRPLVIKLIPVAGVSAAGGLI